MSYDSLGSFLDLPLEERLRIDPNNPGLTRSGTVYLDSNKSAKAYVFDDKITQNSKEFGVTEQEYRRFVAIQEVGGKAVLEQGVTTQKGEAITELMSAMVNPEIAWMTVGPYLVNPEIAPGYSSLVDAARASVDDVLTRYKIDPKGMTNNELFRETLTGSITEVLSRGGSSREIHDLTMKKLASQANPPTTGEEINRAFSQSYLENLAKAAHK